MSKIGLVLDYLLDGNIFYPFWVLQHRCLQTIWTNRRQSEQWQVPHLGRLCRSLVQYFKVHLVSLFGHLLIQASLWSLAAPTNLPRIHNGDRNLVQVPLHDMDLFGSLLWRRSLYTCAKYLKESVRQTGNFTIWYRILIHRSHIRSNPGASRVLSNQVLDLLFTECYIQFAISYTTLQKVRWNPMATWSKGPRSWTKEGVWYCVVTSECLSIFKIRKWFIQKDLLKWSNSLVSTSWLIFSPKLMK